MHVFTSVDLANLPKGSGDSDVSSVLNRSDTGTCFLFLEMLAHADDMLDARILYASEPIENVPDRALPPELEAMVPKSEYVDPTALSDCKRMFTQSVHVLVPVSLTMRPVRISEQPDVYTSLSALFDTTVNGHDKPLARRSAFRLVETILHIFHAVATNELNRWHAQGVEERVVVLLGAWLVKEKRRGSEILITGNPAALERFRYGKGKLPKGSGPLDDVFENWMRYIHIRANYCSQDLSERLSGPEREWLTDALIVSSRRVFMTPLRI